MGNALLILVGAASAQEECPDRLERLDLLDAAERATVEADLPTADEKLRALEAAFSCGPLAEPELLGRMWLVEGAWLELQGDAEAAGDSWRAAQRIAPGRWAEDFGTKLRGAYESANRVAQGGTSVISLDPPLFRWIGAVDGVVVEEFPVTVPPGLHLVQVGPDVDHVQFARILLAFPDTPSVVVTGLVEPTSDGAPAPEPVAEVVPAEPAKPPRNPGRVALHTAVGADAVVGRAGENAAGSEPAFKLLAPVETGLVVRPTAKTWVRAAVSAAPFVNGAFVYDDKFGATTTPTALGFAATGGFAAAQGDMGLLLGYQWPGRVAVRGVLAGALGRSPLRVEGRVGLNAATEGPPEPAFGVVLAFAPRVVDLPEEPEAEAL